MPHVVTQPCCNDASCVPVCPVNCIHPTPSDAGYMGADMLYIDPDVCIDCGACADVCPVGAILPDYDLMGADRAFIDLNASFFRDGAAPRYVPRRAPRRLDDRRMARDGALRVAIVGSGPAGAYAAEALLGTPGLDVAVDMFERLPVPWGLARFGVAPDHAGTRGITAIFERTADDPRFRLVLGVEVGRDIGHLDLRRAYHAVIYATGAAGDRRLGIPGEDLRGSWSAAEFAAWYNGHPDFADRRFDLDTERAVVLGNGNVALDVARILLSDIDALRRTDIADHALAALAESRIREVSVVGRRGPAQAAFTLPELLGLAKSRGFAVQVEMPEAAGLDGFAEHWAGARRLEALGRLASRHPAGGRVLKLLFQRSPVEILGEGSVTGVRFVRNRLDHAADGEILATATDEEDVLDAGMVLRSVGNRGTPIAGLPFDPRRGTVPNTDGRVADSAGGEPAAGTYVTGWIRRGPSGSMGSNRTCAQEAVAALLADMRSGRLPAPAGIPDRLASAIARSGGIGEWRAIDRHERAGGRSSRRPRVKLVDRAEIAKVAREGKAG